MVGPISGYDPIGVFMTHDTTASVPSRYFSHFIALALSLLGSLGKRTAQTKGPLNTLFAFYGSLTRRLLALQRVPPSAAAAPNAPSSFPAAVPAAPTAAAVRIETLSSGGFSHDVLTALTACHFYQSLQTGFTSNTWFCLRCFFGEAFHGLP